MKVKNIAEFNPTPSSPIAGRSEIAYIDTAAVVEGRLGDVQRLTKIFPSRAQREIHTNDILISSVRPNLKHNYFVDGSTDGMIASSGFIHVRVKNSSDVSPRFLYYYLTSPAQVQRYVKISDSSQSAYPSFNKDVVENIDLPGIDLPTQLRIAGVLGSIDEKIELNRKKIAELEALAKTIYDYWFVQFDFPDKNGKPYKSSGGKMVWNELLKREVPEGWGVKALGDIESSIITGKTPSTTDDENFGGDIPFITIDDLRGHIYTYSSERSLSSKGANSQRGKFIPENSLCVSCIGTVGVIAFNAFRSQTNQQINTIVFSKDFNREFLYFFLTRYFSKATVKTGNTFSNMNKGEFAAIQCLVPCKISLTQFHNLAMPIFEQISVCEYQKRMLTNARDCLLPLLMNGQVEVAG